MSSGSHWVSSGEDWTSSLRGGRARGHHWDSRGTGGAGGGAAAAAAADAAAAAAAAGGGGAKRRLYSSGISSNGSSTSSSSSSSLASPPFSYNLHSNRYTMSSSDRPSAAAAVAAALVAATGGGTARRSTAGYPSPAVASKRPRHADATSNNNSPRPSPTSAVAYARSRLAPPYNSPPPSTARSHQPPAAGGSVSQEEFARRYRLAVDDEIARIDELDRVHRWRMLQKVKTQNDKKIAGMIENVHALMEQYGISPSKDSEKAGASLSAGDDAAARAKRAARRDILSAVFEAAPTRISDAHHQRTVSALRHVLEAGSRHGALDGRLSAEGQLCRALVDAGMLGTATTNDTTITSNNNNNNRASVPPLNAQTPLTLDEFVSLAERVHHNVNQDPDNSSQTARPSSPAEQAAEYLRDIGAPNNANILSSESNGSKKPNRKRRKSLLIDVSSSATATTATATATATTKATRDATRDASVDPFQTPCLSGLAREGWLMKLGQNRKTWKRRWFQLLSYGDRGCSLLYFSAPPPSSSSSITTTAAAASAPPAAMPRGNRKGAIHLTGPVAIDEVIDHEASVQQRQEHERQFSITVAAREIVLSCSSMEERSEWIADLNRAISSADGRALQACEPPSTPNPLPTTFGASRSSTFVRPLTKRHHGMTKSMMAVDFDESVFPYTTAAEEEEGTGPRKDATSAAPAVVVLSGYLDKRAGTNSKLLGWQRRYFVQAGKYLKYFKSREDYAKHAAAAATSVGAATKGRGPQGTVSLLSMSMAMHRLDPTGKTGGVFVVVLHGGDRKTIQLRAPSEVEAERWVDSLSNWRELQQQLPPALSADSTPLGTATNQTYPRARFESGYYGPPVTSDLTATVAATTTMPRTTTSEDFKDGSSGISEAASNDDVLALRVASLADAWSATHTERQQCLPLTLSSGKPIDTLLSSELSNRIGACVICGSYITLLSEPSAFEWIGNKDQAWTFVSVIDSRFIVAAQQSTVALLQFLGFERAFLRKRCAEGKAFRLLLFPLETTHCGQIVRPTWDGLLALVEQESPTCGYKLGKHVPTLKAMSLKEHLELGQAVDVLPAEELEQACSFEAYANAGEESLRHARSFLRHTLKCSRLFTGQGYTMAVTKNNRRQAGIGRGGEVVMVRTQPVANIPGCRWIALKVSAELIDEAFGESSFEEEREAVGKNGPALTSAEFAQRLGPLPAAPSSSEQIRVDLLRTSSALDAMPSGHFHEHHELRHADYREGEENVPIQSLSAVEGELRKYTHRAFNNTWQTRFFSTDNFYLRYRMKSSKAGEYSGTIDLRDVDRIELLESKKKKIHEFRLCYDTGDDPYRLSARTREDAERWVAALRERTKRRPPPPPSTRAPRVRVDEEEAEAGTYAEGKEEEEDTKAYEDESENKGEDESEVESEVEDEDEGEDEEDLSHSNVPPPSPPPPPPDSPRLRRRRSSLGSHLLEAVMADDLMECLEILDVQHGPLNFADAKENNTPLHAACLGTCGDIVAALLLRGANPDLVDSQGSTPLNLACQIGALDIAKWLIVSGDVDPKLTRQLAPRLSPGVARSRPADVNIPDNQGVTPLMHAAKYGHGELVALLLAAGADVGAKDASGRTAADFAVESDESSLVDMLRGKHHDDTSASPPPSPLAPSPPPSPSSSALEHTSTVAMLMGGGMPESLRGDGSSAEQHSVAANRERQTRYDELSEIKVKANWPLKEPADRHQLARSSTATLLMGDVPPTPSTPAPRKSKLIEVRDEEVSAPPMPTGPVPRKSMLPDDAEAFVHKEEDEVEKVDDIKKDAPPPPPPPPPPNSLLVVDQPSVSEFAAGTRVLALYSQDELFYEATVVEKVAEGENSYVVVFDGYGAEEVSTDVRDIDASLSEFDVNSDGEEGAIGHEEVLMRKDSVMKDLIKTLSARKMHTLGSGVDNEEGIAVSHAPSAAAPTTNVLVNPVMDRPRLPHRRPVRRRKRGKGHLSTTF